MKEKKKKYRKSPVHGPCQDENQPPATGYFLRKSSLQGKERQWS
jgi:hypothetical protein